MKICRQNQDLPLQVESPQSLETSPLRSGEVYFLSLALVVTWHWSRAQSVRAWDYIRIINTIADDYLVSSYRVQRYVVALPRMPVAVAARLFWGYQYQGVGGTHSRLSGYLYETHNVLII